MSLGLAAPLCYKIPFSCVTYPKIFLEGCFEVSLVRLSPLLRHAPKKKCSISRAACANGFSRS